MRVSPTRSRMMRAVRMTDTGPERQVRSALHRRGLRFKIDDNSLPGRPDIVFPRHECVVFVHGCFWHGHKCRYFRWPNTRKVFWSGKINGNRERDRRVEAELLGLGWRVATVWECALRDQRSAAVERRMDRLANWIGSRNHRRVVNVSAMTR